MFPKFLHPPIVFRARQRNAGHPSTSNTTHPSSAEENKDKTDERYLNGHTSYIRCSNCAADLCMTSQIISKGFVGRHGRAYLVSAEPTASAISMNPSCSPVDSLPNTTIRRPVLRQLVTGNHTVSDIDCAFCGSVLGWKYIAAEEESQRYKVGKFILETKRITTSSCWESGSFDQTALPESSNPGEPDLATLDDHIEFDSQDEDECEDLFAGIWSPGLATRRRSRKLDRRPSLFGFTSPNF